MDKLEDLMNSLTDRDWSWWPVLFLRPNRDQLIDSVLLLKMTAVFGTAIGVLWFLWITVSGGQTLSLSVFALLMILGWVFFLAGYKFTFAYFWNRRARRLQKNN